MASVSQPARALPAPTTASGSVYYLYDLAGNVVTELSATGDWNRVEIYAAGKHVATYSGGASGTTYFDHDDWLGTERARTDAQGGMTETCTSLAFGDDLSCTGTDASPLHFTGKQHDNESGLDDFGARYYGSGAGRFMSSDWSSVPVAVPYADLTNPQTMNLYAIVRDNPETFADLDGHCGPDHVPDCKDNATTANGALAAAGEGYPDPQKRGDGLTKSPTQQVQEQISATASDNTVTITTSSFDPATGNGSITTETRTGNHPFRDNNPGDIRSGDFANANGAIGNDKGIAIFPTAATGSQALTTLLNGSSYQKLTLDQAVARFAPPSENNTAAYQAAARGAVGVSGSTGLSALSSAQRGSFEHAIARQEGFYHQGVVNRTTIVIVPPF
jgi:RHS repeat-associated protein